jgi:hypothetical protein
MNEYLSKDFIAKILDAHLEDSRGAEHYAYNTLKRELMVAPESDVVEVKYGHWIEDYVYDPDPHDRIRYKCSKCDLILDGVAQCFTYCPNCGARMDL